MLTQNQIKADHKKRSAKAYERLKKTGYNWLKAFTDRHFHEYENAGYTLAKFRALVSNVANQNSFDPAITEKLEALATDLEKISKPVITK